MHREKDLTLLAKVWPPPAAPPPCPSTLATFKCEPYRRAPNLARRGAILTSWSINYSGQRVMTNPSSFISFSPSQSEWQHLDSSGQRYIYSVMIHKVVFFLFSYSVFYFVVLSSNGGFSLFPTCTCPTLCYYWLLENLLAFNIRQPSIIPWYHKHTMTWLTPCDIVIPWFAYYVSSASQSKGFSWLGSAQSGPLFIFVWLMMAVSVLTNNTSSKYL